MNYEYLKILDELREKGVLQRRNTSEKEKILNNTSIGSGKGLYSE